MTYDQMQVAYNLADRLMESENISWKDALKEVLAWYGEVA